MFIWHALKVEYAFSELPPLCNKHWIQFLSWISICWCSKLSKIMPHLRSAYMTKIKFYCVYGCDFFYLNVVVCWDVQWIFCLRALQRGLIYERTFFRFISYEYIFNGVSFEWGFYGFVACNKMTRKTKIYPSLANNNVWTIIKRT